MSDGIGASVRRRRVEAGIRQDHLAERVGISASHLSRFERGKRHVSLTTLDAIVRALLELGVESLPELTKAGLEASGAISDGPDRPLLHPLGDGLENALENTVEGLKGGQGEPPEPTG